MRWFSKYTEPTEINTKNETSPILYSDTITTHTIKTTKEVKEPSEREYEFGYKGMTRDMKCRDMQYEIGKTYKMPYNEVKLCDSGFHYCSSLVSTFGYYDMFTSRFFKVKCAKHPTNPEDYVYGGDKQVTDIIEILEEVTEDELFEAIQSRLKETHELRDHVFTREEFEANRFNRTFFSFKAKLDYEFLHSLDGKIKEWFSPCYAQIVLERIAKLSTVEDVYQHYHIRTRIDAPTYHSYVRCIEAYHDEFESHDMFIHWTERLLNKEIKTAIAN